MIVFGAYQDKFGFVKVKFLFIFEHEIEILNVFQAIPE